MVTGLAAASGSLGATNGANPYPVRTMIGNLYYYIRQHRKPIILVPSMLRIAYQYRRPLMKAIQSLSKGADIGSAAGSAAAQSIMSPTFSLPSALSNVMESAAAASSNVPMYAPPPPGAFGNLIPNFASLAAAGQPSTSNIASPLMPMGSMM